MDKYQLFASKYIRYYFVEDSTIKPKDHYMVIEGESIDLKQAENYNIVKYTLLFEPAFVSSISVNGKKYKDLVEIPDYHGLIAVPIDFTKRAEELVIELKSKATDDIHVKLNYVEADKKIFDAKEADRIRRETADKAQIKIATGTDLVNIYFQPCCDAYQSTTIELYSTSNGRMLLGKFKVDEGMFFKAITGLAFGHYEIKLAQFDKNGKELFISDPLPFELKAPSFGGGNGRHTVYG